MGEDIEDIKEIEKNNDEFVVKKDNKKKTSKVFLFISYTLIVILVTLLINNEIVIKRIEKKTGTLSIEEYLGKDEETAIRTIAKNLKAIREKLKQVYKGEIDDSKLIETAMKGYVAGIGDKYTEYYTKEEYNSIKEDVSGKYVGIGVELQDKNGSKVITGIMKGTPAEESGLKENDIITKVNNIDVKDKSLSDTVKEIKVARKEIKIDSTTHKLLKNGIGYLDIKSFSENSDKDVEKAIEEMKKEGMKKLIIDLRYNGGGDVKSTKNIADLFLDKDKEIYSTINAKGFKKTVYTETKAKYDFEIVLLVNKYSASASELLTAALKENKRAKEVVGETTYGKGVIQGVYPSSIGGALKATIEEYFGPRRIKIK